MAHPIGPVSYHFSISTCDLPGRRLDVSNGSERSVTCGGWELGLKSPQSSPIVDTPFFFPPRHHETHPNHHFVYAIRHNIPNASWRVLRHFTIMCGTKISFPSRLQHTFYQSDFVEGEKKKRKSGFVHCGPAAVFAVAKKKLEASSWNAWIRNSPRGELYVDWKGRLVLSICCIDSYARAWEAICLYGWNGKGRKLPHASRHFVWFERLWYWFTDRNHLLWKPKFWYRLYLQRKLNTVRARTQL